ncbi:putative membrane protein [Apostasia shenzhenica]|uniref:Putative membrane protein n=1 Tax=Apostasia shenzhenica TaxID=1088818 RepID=A0A2I0AKN4_9ASPA|nr:putative membrane protein [Apostasia shenzhenica]
MSSTAARPRDSLHRWFEENYEASMESVKYGLRISYVVFAFCSALFVGALKGLLVGPVAGLLLILGNIGVILGLFPAHVAWTVYSILMTNRINAALKFAVIFALPVLFGLWLALSIFGSVLVGVGYGFFAPWISTFEAFRHNSEVKKFLHSIVDGTWGTIKGSCTVVRDFADLCYHSYPLYLKELRERTRDHQTYSIRLVEVPACIVVGLLGLVVDVPLYTVIALMKSPFMLFKGWQRLLHDLITREGPFLETACVPVAGLAILFWPLIVVGSVLLAIVSSIFVGLYASVVVYQERSFKRGVAYVVAIVAEFDEYTNDLLYLRDGSFVPKPQYRKKKSSHSSELSVGSNADKGVKGGAGPLDAPAMFVPRLVPARSVREAIQEVKMVQIWEELMKCSEMRGKELIDLSIIKAVELNEWLNTKQSKQDMVALGLPSYALLHAVLYSVEAGSNGLLLSNGIEVNHLNRPEDRLLDWFFQPLMVLKEQIKVHTLEVEEVKFLEKLVLFNGDILSMQSWDNGSAVPNDALRTAQIQAISRRLVGMTRTISKFPTYRRKYRQVVKTLIAYSNQKEGSGSTKMHFTRSASSSEIVPADV